MQFLSSLFGSIAKATLGVFVGLGLLHGSVATNTISQNPVNNSSASVQIPLQDNFQTANRPTEQNAISTTNSNATPSKANVSSNTAPPVAMPVLGTVMCQGTARQACPTGKIGVCMPNGNYYCTTALPPTPTQVQQINQPAQQPAAPTLPMHTTPGKQSQDYFTAWNLQTIASLEATLQSDQNLLTKEESNIASVQDKYDQQCSALMSQPIEFQQGGAAIQMGEALGKCNALAQELLSSTNLEAPLLNQISYIQEQIYILQGSK